MARIIVELVAVFLIPFLAYAGFLIFQARNPSAARAILQSRALVIQSLIGLVLMVLALLAYGLADEQHRGAYRPAEFKNGQLVPGKVD
jgi:uncharacterized membrane protein YjgN (DUF898 family)